MNDVELADITWSREYVAGLIEGESSVEGENGDVLIRPRDTAFEMRQKALDGYAGVESVLDGIQLQQAIARIPDIEARAMMAASVTMGLTRWWSAEDILNSAGLRTTSRAGRRVWDKGISAIAKGERSRRVAKPADPVCWRCMKSPVVRAGEECGCADKPGPGVKIKRTEDMSLSELIATQSEPVHYNRAIPGGSYYEKMVTPGGFNPLTGDSDNSW